LTAPVQFSGPEVELELSEASAGWQCVLHGTGSYSCYYRVRKPGCL
jgi:hypothetical protein